jgi:hypothetical protein
MEIGFWADPTLDYATTAGVPVSQYFAGFEDSGRGMDARELAFAREVVSGSDCERK